MLADRIVMLSRVLRQLEGAALCANQLADLRRLRRTATAGGASVPAPFRADAA